MSVICEYPFKCYDFFVLLLSILSNMDVLESKSLKIVKIGGANFSNKSSTPLADLGQNHSP